MSVAYGYELGESDVSDRYVDLAEEVIKRGLVGLRPTSPVNIMPICKPFSEPVSSLFEFSSVVDMHQCSETSSCSMARNGMENLRRRDGLRFAQDGERPIQLRQDEHREYNLNTHRSPTHPHHSVEKRDC